jgi:hypothetical protein
VGFVNILQEKRMLLSERKEPEKGAKERKM